MVWERNENVMTFDSNKNFYLSILILDKTTKNCLKL